MKNVILSVLLTDRSNNRWRKTSIIVGLPVIQFQLNNAKFRWDNCSLMRSKCCLMLKCLRVIVNDWNDWICFLFASCISFDWLIAASLIGDLFEKPIKKHIDSHVLQCRTLLMEGIKWIKVLVLFFCVRVMAKNDKLQFTLQSVWFITRLQHWV